MKVRDRYIAGRQLVANTTRRPGWNVYEVVEDQSDVSRDRVRVFYIGDGVRQITIPKSTVFLSCSSQAEATKACGLLNDAEEAESQSILSASRAKHIAKDLVRTVYET